MRTPIMSAGALFTAFLVASATSLAVDFRRADATLSDVHAATCRVRVSNARGTGIFNGYNAEGTRAYVSTNDHVTSNNRTCYLDFWTNSKMETVAGTVVYKSRNDQTGRDFSIIEVDAEALKKIDPPYIPMKAMKPERLAGRAFLSSGCPDGRFDQGWRGTIERIEGNMAIFSPPPVPGQSGSGICVVDGGKVYDVAKLTYLLGAKGLDESKGGALPLANLIGAIQRSRTNYTITPVADSAAPRLLAFTSKDCPACAKTAPGLDAAELSDGLVVERVDALAEDGAAIARKYGVVEIPTYLAVDGDGVELARANYDEIARIGAREAANNLITRAAVKIKPKTTPVPEPLELEIDDEPLDRRYKLGEDNGILVSSPGEIEKTIAVYITDPESYDFDAERVAATSAPVGLLQDLLRDDRDGEEEAPEPTPIIPRRRDVPEEEKDARGGIGSRAIDALADKLGAKIDAGIDRAGAQIANGLKDAGDEITERVETTVKTQTSSIWRRIRARVIVFALLIVVIGTIAARAVASFARATVERIRAIAQIAQTASGAPTSPGRKK